MQPILSEATQREWRAEDVFRHPAPGSGIRRADAHGSIEAEPRMAPAEEFADHRLVNPPLAEAPMEDAMAKEARQRVENNLRKPHEPTARRKDAIGHQGMQVGVDVDQIPIGLDDHDDAGDGLRVLPRCADERLEGGGGTMTECPE